MAQPIKKNFELCPQDLSDKYSDAKLTTKDAEDKIIKVHRVFLAKVSHKMENLFDEAKLNDNLIIVRNIRFEILSAIVNFLYSGKVMLAEKSPEFIEDFLDGITVLKIDIGELVEKEILDQFKESKAVVALTNKKNTSEDKFSSFSVKLEYSNESSPSKLLDVNDNKKRSRSESESSSKMNLRPEIKITRLQEEEKEKHENYKDLRGKLIETKIKHFRSTFDEEKRTNDDTSSKEESSANSSQNPFFRSSLNESIQNDLYLDYSCELCSAVCNSSTQFRDHMELKHKIYEEDCEGFDDDRKNRKEFNEKYRFNPKYSNADPRWNAKNQVGYDVKC